MEMISLGGFDAIYHEHVYYFTLTTLMPLFAQHELRITRVERTSLHGGSLRIFVRQIQHEADETVALLLAEENKLGAKSIEFLRNFVQKAEGIREALRKQVSTLQADGKTIAAYGAAAKGAVLLNYCGLGVGEVAFVADRSPHKQGLLMPGVRVPIVPAEELVGRNPDVALLLAWNFAEEIMAQQSPYRRAGGKFLIPIPEVRLV